MGIAKAYPHERRKRGKAYRPLLAVLKYGASHRHYVYLQNGPAQLSSLTPEARALLPTGTTATLYAPLDFVMTSLYAGVFVNANAFWVPRLP